MDCHIIILCCSPHNFLHLLCPGMEKRREKKSRSERSNEAWEKERLAHLWLRDSFGMFPQISEGLAGCGTSFGVKTMRRVIVFEKVSDKLASTQHPHIKMAALRCYHTHNFQGDQNICCP